MLKWKWKQPFRLKWKWKQPFWQKWKWKQPFWQRDKGFPRGFPEAALVHVYGTLRTSSQAPSYASLKLWPTERLTHLLTGVKCRATSVANNTCRLTLTPCFICRQIYQSKQYSYSTFNILHETLPCVDPLHVGSWNGLIKEICFLYVWWSAWSLRLCIISACLDLAVFSQRLHGIETPSIWFAST